MADVKKMITDLPLGTPTSTDVIPFVDIVTNTTKKATKADLKGDAATVDVGTTTTLVPGSAATVANSGTVNDAILDFGIPAGAVIHSTVIIPNNSVGVNGDWAFSTSSTSEVYFKSGGAWALVNSNKGATGEAGPTGAAATATAGTTTTLSAGSAATVTNVGTVNAAIFDFGIPKGADGIGDVNGPASAVDGNFASFDLATGKKIKDSGKKAADFQTVLTNPVTGTGTINEISYWTSSSAQGTLPVATYPSLTELSYVKGVTSGVQSQLNGKQASGSYAALAGSTAQAFSASTLDVGNADTTIARVSGGVISVEGNNIITANQQVTALAATAAGDKDKYCHSNASTGALEWSTVTGGASLWTLMPGTPTRVGNTSFTVTGDITTYVAKGMIIKWTESSTVRMAMVSIPSTYGAPNTTITIVGDTMASIDASSLKYCMLGAEAFVEKFAVAGTIGATGTDIANAFYAQEPMRVLGADLYVGTAGTTNATTIDINKAGTTMFTTKPTLATTVATSPTPFTANTTSALALNDRVSIDIDAVQTTAAIDLYVKLYLFPTRYINLT